MASLALVRDFNPTGAWVFLTMALAWGSDTAAYFVGRKFGKTKLAPRISPKKTLEGSAGGLAASVLGALAMSFFLPGLSPIDAIALGILAGAAGQAGDLLVSVLKRSSGVKDSGGILPGHGGILDRVDALAFTAPATWAYGHFIAGF
jgi:phosphatidate cytidylyltransferase